MKISSDNNIQEERIGLAELHPSLIDPDAIPIPPALADVGPEPEQRTPENRSNLREVRINIADDERSELPAGKGKTALLWYPKTKAYGFTHVKPPIKPVLAELAMLCSKILACEL